jgi:UDP-N-acetylmuramoyl-tripeptide--D-alanyl-D-alanine ligase
MFTLGDIVQGVGDEAQIVRGNETPFDDSMIFRAAHHDSRQIEAGDLFVAIRGAHVDGHTFLAQVARLGALGAFCLEPSRTVRSEFPDFLQIVVPDVVKALQKTARVRTQRQQGTTLIGITGSNGKTSTKEAAASVLSHAAPTLKTQASYNNEIGYPLTLLRLEPQHRYAVLEMGAQWVGELAWLSSSIARPDWSLITSVGSAHIEYFGSQERIVIAKTELVQALRPDGIAILNYDDANVRGMSASTRVRILYYGQGEGADVRAADVTGDMLLGRSCTLQYRGEQQRVQLHLPGEHGVTIALAAASVGCAADMPLAEIAQVLETLGPAKGRGEIKAGPNGSTCIDDSYNANRQSILAITRAMKAAHLAPDARRWAVLGDIFEMGPYAQAEHTQCGRELAGTLDNLIAIGDEARYFVEGAIAAGMPEFRTYYFHANVEDAAELEAAKQAAADLLRREVRSHDLVLLKGSRGMRMETMLSSWS